MPSALRIIQGAILLIVTIIASNALAQVDQSATTSLNEAFDQLVSYEHGDSQAPLRIIRKACWEAMDDPEDSSQLSTTLSSLLLDERATRDAKRFACRQLALVGQESALGNLFSVVHSGGSVLALDALFAMEAIPGGIVVIENLRGIPELPQDVQSAVESALQRELLSLDRMAASGTEEEIAALIQVAGTKYDFECAARARELVAAARGSDVDEYLVAALEEEESSEGRAVIASLLGQRGAIGQRATLENLADSDEDAGVRVAALLALVEFLRADQSGERVELIARALAGAEQPDAEAAAFDALATVPSAEALALAMHHFTENGSTYAAKTAIVIARAIGDDPELREAALEAVQGVYESSAVNPELRAAAGDAIAHIDRNVGFIQSWQVSGPYTLEGAGQQALFDEEFAPESAAESTDVEWSEVATEKIEPPGIVNLSRAVGGNDRVAYLRATVRSDRAQPARLEMGSDDGVKAWVNSELVHGNNVMRGLTLNSDVVPITLKEGENIILFKIVQSGGDWKAAARIRADDGARAEGVRIE